MTRNQHDVVNDHFGVLDQAQMADGTPTSGYAPVSNGDGTTTWGPAGGGGVTLLVDGTLNSVPTVLMDGTDAIAADGSTDSVYGAVVMPTGHNSVEIYAQDGSTYADIWADAGTGRVEFYATDGMLLAKLASAPSGPSEGQAYYDTTTHKLRVYDGTTWQNCW